MLNDERESKVKLRLGLLKKKTKLVEEDGILDILTGDENTPESGSRTPDSGLRTPD